jgi:hydroxymethylbilane synthase
VRRKVTVGTRGSKLALIQTNRVAELLRRLNVDVEIVRIVTAGDRDRRTPLESMGVSIFVKELEEALLDGRIDIAVHSLKDLPTELPPGLTLLATPERVDPRDVLVAKSPLNSLPAGSRIGTGSLRRSRQLSAYRPDLRVADIRGNVDTRLEKAVSADYDGVVLAAAGVMRLGLADRITEYLPLEHFLPDPGQAALAIEGRADDPYVADVARRLNNPNVWSCVTAERALLAAVGGGCRAPVGALAVIKGGRLTLDAMVADPEGAGMVRGSEEGSPEDADNVGQKLAGTLLAKGAADFVTRARNR